MLTSKRVIIGAAVLLVWLMLGFFLSLMDGPIDKGDKSDREQMPAKVTVSSGNKGGTVYSGTVTNGMKISMHCSGSQKCFSHFLSWSV